MKTKIIPMNAKEAIQRFCALQSKVQDRLGWHYAADCFCGDGGFWKAPDYDGSFEGGYRNDGKAIEYIEMAVNAKIEESKIDRAIELIQRNRTNPSDALLQDAIISLVDYKNNLKHYEND